MLTLLKINLRFRWLRRYWKDEDGAIMLLSLFIFAMMVIVGGIAVDVAHYERDRTLIQQQLDAAVLAAASLTQDVPAEDVVNSYMAAVGLNNLKFIVESNENKTGGIVVGRTVSASVEGGIDTYFMRYLGVANIGMPLLAEASETVENIEIALVLDVSGSMGPYKDSRKIQSLRNAAKSFVREVLSDAEENRVSISIVPYSTNVNAGPDILGKYKTTTEHSYSNCVDFKADDFTNLQISPTVQLQRSGHFQFQAMSMSDPANGQWVCRIDNGFRITPLSQSAAHLEARLEDLTPEGSTSIDIGVKWGLALLDPSTRPVVSDLISDGIIEQTFSGRPFDYGHKDSLKVLVIMTDGENDTEYRLRDEYRKGPSSIYRMKENGKNRQFYSINAPERSYAQDGDKTYPERYFWPTNPFDGSYRDWSNDTIYNNKAMNAYRSGWSEAELNWPEVFAEASPLWAGYNLFGRQYNESRYWSTVANNFSSSIRYEIGQQEKDARVSQICAEAMKRKITVFTIGFEVASQRSLDLLLECASSEAHYFDVEGLEIDSAFEMIASSINMLRLTQ